MKAALIKAKQEVSTLTRKLGEAHSSLKILRDDYDRQVKQNNELRRVVRSIHQQTKI